MRQDKDRGVTILDRKDYIQKCVSILNSIQFLKLDTAPTKSLESKVTRTLRKKNTILKKMSIKSYTQQVQDRDCFMEHEKYVNYNSNNNNNKYWKNLQ